jgi:electron transport complex protein RnfB
MSSAATPEQIDAILPQTQCGLCGYGGCMPYAKALVNENAALDLCPPGGIPVLRDIADLMQRDASPFVAEMEKKAKPKLLALIREAECIGCAKCIQACPVDAILGSAKQMHTVIAMECTGCELCVAPCPVDCIDMVAIPEKSVAEEKQKANLARQRFQSREQRLADFERGLPKPKAAALTQSIDDKKNYVKEAVLRARMKKNL